jgi:MoaA/NifB/PqqE/SkfB family radical SAM enzyme
MTHTLIHDPDDYDCKVTFSNGEQLLLNTNQLKPHHELWQFENWKCNAGTDLLMIAGDMTVYSCNSKHDNMGNLLDPNFSMLQSPVRCTRSLCQPKNMDLSCSKNNLPNL